MRITAAVARVANGPFTIEQLDLDEPREDEVCVRIVGTGICHTDLSLRDQMLPIPFPVVLGHEGAGVVTSVGGRVTKVAPGDHVVMSFMSCGQCRNCLTGLPAGCERIFELNFACCRTDGSRTLRARGAGAGPVHASFFSQSSFATHALANERNVVKVPKDLPLRILGPLGCGVMTGAGSVLAALRPPAGSSLAVFGTGAVGLSAIMAARATGCSTIVGVDINERRLDLARDLGATHAIDARQGNAAEIIRGITHGGADYSIDATGVPAVTRQAVECLRVPGTCGLVGGAPFGTEFSFAWESLFFGRGIRGIVAGEVVPELFIPRLIELYRDGRFPFDRLLEFYALAEINEAAGAAAEGRVLKPVLLMD
jgi:aryl-alcohol dehydrogenase